jgi:hypothetical protein
VEFAVRRSCQPIEGIGCQLTAGHEVDELLEWNGSRLTDLFVGLSHGSYGEPEPTTDRVFGRCSLTSMPAFKQPRQLGSDSSFDLGVAGARVQVVRFHSGTS